MDSLMIACGITRSILEFRFLRDNWSQQKIPTKKKKLRIDL